MGFKVGDLVFTGSFPAVIMSDVNTSTPCCEVFGFEQECGSAYATDLKPMSKEEFLEQAARYGHTPPFRMYGKRSLEGLVAAGIEAVKAG